MLAAESIEFSQHRGGGQAHTVHTDDIAVCIFQIEVLGQIGRFFRRDRPAPHIFLGFDRRVFKRAAFVGNMQQIGIHRIRTAAGLVFHFHRNAVLLRIRQQFFATQQIPFAPRCDDLDIGIQRIRTEFEAHLVVALAGRAVRNRLRAGRGGDLDQTLGD